MQGPKILLIAGLLVGLPAASWFWMFNPSGAELVRMQEENRRKKQSIQEAETALADGGRREKTRKLKEALELFKQRLPDQNEMSTVMNDVARIAKTHKLDAQKYSTVSDVAKQSYGEHTVRWTIVGTFKPNLTDFFNELERLPRIMRISELKIEGDEKHSGNVTATFLMTTYYTPRDSGGERKVAVAQ